MAIDRPSHKPTHLPPTSFRSNPGSPVLGVTFSAQVSAPGSFEAVIPSEAVRRSSAAGSRPGRIAVSRRERCRSAREESSIVFTEGQQLVFGEESVFEVLPGPLFVNMAKKGIKARTRGRAGLKKGRTISRRDRCRERGFEL